ncbi:MAG: sigma-70 family RNA polymerase sigma factor [Thermoleophilia bacterium]|nr:sigma-70 family RNA polymerase sigma factor [Thermoleophilia bacterium]MDQ3858159.1 sigma-70 family RNA polymerase sigma factor [Actinomycetota bacterium]
MSDQETSLFRGGRDGRRDGMERAQAAMIEDEPTWPAAENGRARRPGSADVRGLVADAQAGNRRALEELYLLHFDRIYSYLQLSVGNRHDAEDLTNQTFIKMIESIDRFVWRQAPFSAWLFRIAHNLAMDHFRAGRRWQPEEEPPESADALEASAEDEALRTIGREIMLATIEPLSREQRQVLTLKFVFDFSNAEVAAILGKTEGAIKSLQHRAVASLQRQLAGNPGR